jgi:uncharacterized protein (TIGR02117 family)
VLAALVWLSLAPGDPDLYPPQGAVRVPVLVVDHGYHSGLVVRAVDLSAIAAALEAEHPGPARLLMAFPQLWPGAEWFEFGWGDAAFYQATPTVADLDLGLTIPALFWPTPSVVQVVPGVGSAERAFAGVDQVALELSASGWRALAIRLGESIAPGAGALPEPVGPSLYGVGLFFRSPLSYHAGRTCNQWTAGLLRSAGVPSSWFWSITSTGLVQELRLRAVR